MKSEIQKGIGLQQKNQIQFCLPSPSNLEAKKMCQIQFANRVSCQATEHPTGSDKPIEHIPFYNLTAVCHRQMRQVRQLTCLDAPKPEDKNRIPPSLSAEIKTVNTPKSVSRGFESTPTPTQPPPHFPTLQFKKKSTQANVIVLSPKAQQEIREKKIYSNAEDSNETINKVFKRFSFPSKFIDKNGDKISEADLETDSGTTEKKTIDDLLQREIQLTLQLKNRDKSLQALKQLLQAKDDQITWLSNNIKQAQDSQAKDKALIEELRNEIKSANQAKQSSLMKVQQIGNNFKSCQLNEGQKTSIFSSSEQQPRQSQMEVLRIKLQLIEGQNLEIRKKMESMKRIAENSKNQLFIVREQNEILQEQIKAKENFIGTLYNDLNVLDMDARQLPGLRHLNYVNQALINALNEEIVSITMRVCSFKYALD